MVDEKEDNNLKVRRELRLKEVGERLRTVRKYYRLTQEDFCRDFYISRAMLSELENGKRVPTGPLLSAMEGLFSVGRSWIMRGEGSMLSGGEEFTHRLAELLGGYRKLSAGGKTKLLDFLRIIVITDEEREGG